MIPEAVTIHFLTPGSEQECLTVSERERASSFRFVEDAKNWTTWRSGLRRILGEALGLPPLDVPIVLGPFGKPMIAPPHQGLHFSLSHCNDLALVAVCPEGPLGIDLEPLNRAKELLGCEEGFCHPRETQTMPGDPVVRACRLLEHWCAKEALLKCIGTGFSHPPTGVWMIECEVGFTVSPDTPLPGWNPHDKIIRLRHPRLEGHCAALACGTNAIHFHD